MQKLPTHTLNRNALTLIPQKPMWDWVNYLTPDHPHDPDTHNDYNTYLIRGEIDPDELEDEIKKHFKVMFENELYGWWIDESDWPQTRTWEVFNEWFEVKFSALIFDLDASARLRTD